MSDESPYRDAEAAFDAAVARLTAAHQRFVEVNHDQVGTMRTQDEANGEMISSLRASLNALHISQQATTTTLEQLVIKQSIIEEQASALQDMIAASVRLRDRRSNE